MRLFGVNSTGHVRLVDVADCKIEVGTEQTNLLLFALIHKHFISFKEFLIPQLSNGVQSISNTLVSACGLLLWRQVLCICQH